MLPAKKCDARGETTPPFAAVAEAAAAPFLLRCVRGLAGLRGSNRVVVGRVNRTWGDGPRAAAIAAAAAVVVVVVVADAVEARGDCCGLCERVLWFRAAF